jgi:hypothetical protein
MNPHVAPAPYHDCNGIDCDVCIERERQEAEQRLAAIPQKSKRFSARKRMTGGEVKSFSATVPAQSTYRKLVPGDAAYTQVEAARKANVWVCDSADHNLTSGCSNPECFKAKKPIGARPTEEQAILAYDEDEASVPGRITKAQDAVAFITAGNAYFTLRSTVTGVRYTYRVNPPKDQDTRWGKKYFVALLSGPDNTADYTYLGMLQDNVFRLTRASKMTADSKPVVAFKWTWERLVMGVFPKGLEVWHEGRCGRCGRKLTVPESVEAGIGPECAGKMGM